MNTSVFIPSSLQCATREWKSTRGLPLESLSKEKFVRAWCVLSYLHPGLHPDGFEEPDSGWAENLKPYAVEAWRRNETGELADEEMYPSDATWAGIYDRMQTHSRV